MTINIRKAEMSDMDDLVKLFDQYMIFYKQDSAPEKFREYLESRLKNNEATVFITYNSDNIAVGFVLNYFSFSSVSLGKVIVLNDLFVDSEHRKLGVGRLLIEESLALAKQVGALRVDLGTAIENTTAQSLYEDMGFVRDTEYYSYSYSF